MQITVQMLDGSITPFKVRSSITIASLKAKFEPWQPMKGRALLHHDTQLDDHVTLGSVPGVKDGTILRVDKHVSQMKNKSSEKKKVMSGPASSTADEEVVESIEMSGDDEEASSEDERRMSSSKRKRPSRTSAATIEDFVDDDDIAKSQRARALQPGEISDDPMSLTEANLSSRTMALHIAKREKRKSTAREQAGFLASEALELSHRLHSHDNTFASYQENPIENPTASAHVPKITKPISSGDDIMKDDDDDDDATFLAGINAAAAESEKLPPHSEAGPGDDVSARRCVACGRACGCGGDPMAMSDIVVPVEEHARGQDTSSSPNSNSIGHLVSKRISTSQRAELSWTGM